MKYSDYNIPEGYKGMLYSGNWFYCDEEHLDDPLYFDRPVSDDVFEFYDDFDECKEQLLSFIPSFSYADAYFQYVVPVISAVNMDGNEPVGESAWNAERTNFEWIGEPVENESWLDENFREFRDFNGLEHLCSKQWHTDNNCGYSSKWVTRLIRVDGGEPIIEFYSCAKINQFVSDYYCSTFLGTDGYGFGWGHGIDLYVGAPSWKLTAHDADMIRSWVESKIS